MTLVPDQNDYDDQQMTDDDSQYENYGIGEPETYENFIDEQTRSGRSLRIPAIEMLDARD